MRGMVDQIRRFGDQPGLRRAMPAILILAVTVLALAGWILLREPARVTLYPGLPEAEKARVIDSLTGGGIAAVIDERTGEVAVPGADYHRARMLLAAQGLPQGLPDGNALLNDLPMGTSKSVETARLRQAQGSTSRGRSPRFPPSRRRACIWRCPNGRPSCARASRRGRASSSRS